MSPKCLIIDEMYPGIEESLRSIGVDPIYMPEINREGIISEIGQYEGLIVRSKTAIDIEILKEADKLKFIARAGAGIDNIDEEECIKRDIRVFNAPEANRDAVGEHALAMLLCLYNNINTSDQEVRQSIWEREGNRGIEIMGKTVGIIGFGNMGSSFARRLSGFGCKIIAYDKYKENYGTNEVTEADLAQIFNECDILSLHVPLTEDTNKMIDKEFLNRFKKPITLINTARGKVLVLKDLIWALKNGKVRAAALDVLENEKIHQLSDVEQQVFDDLIQMSNVLLTPHVAGWSFESYAKINDILVAKIKSFLAES